MATKKNKKVKDNYDFYHKLLAERKSIFSEIIEINECKPNKGNTLQKLEPLIHKSIPDNMVLIVEVKKNNYSFFQFKLRYKDYINEPFFRFDSDGETHRNKLEGIPLKEQSIDPPHFHKYNSNGIEIAYKTEKFLNEKECKALEDINLCIAHFFQESNTRVNEDDYPELKIMPDTLGFSFKISDPNQNVTFP